MRKSNGNLAANGTLYWYMTPGVVAETDLAGTLKSEYVFFDGERVARRDGATGTGGVFYYFSHHLKTASVITDSAGVIKAESDYYPWGGELQFVNNDSNDYKFTGKKRDTETGLDYFGARYYSNGLGRWTSADWSATPVPVPYADFHDPQSLNLYGYVRNIPTSRADLDGHCPDGGCPVPPRTLAELDQQNQAKVDVLSDAGKGLANAAVDIANFVHNALSLGSSPIADDNIPTPFPNGSATTKVTAFVAPFLIPGGQEEATVKLLGEGAKIEKVEQTAIKGFDEARVEAFQKAGMTDAADVKFTRVDPKTGTVVEFKGPDGASVRYDAPHPATPGPAHSQQHISYQTKGKVSQGGRQRGNIPYSGPQHPSSGGRGVGDVEPH